MALFAGEDGWVLLTDILMNGKDDLSVEDFAESIRAVAGFVRTKQREAQNEQTDEDVIGVTHCL